jgi:hypothetical protein
MHVHYPAVNDVAVEELVNITKAGTGLIPFEDHRQLLLKVTHYEIVLQMALFLQLKIETVQSGEAEVEEKGLRGRAHPQKGGEVLVHKKNTFLYLPLPPNQQLDSEHKALLKLVSNLTFGCLEEIPHQTKALVLILIYRPSPAFVMVCESHRLPARPST